MPAADAEDDVRQARSSEAYVTLRASVRVGSTDSRSSLISRSAIDSGFSCTWVSTSGPTYSSRPSPSWE